MSATEKLQHAQQQLDKMGVKDVKFFFKPEARSALYSDLQNDVADVLTKFFGGGYRDLKDFSDEVLPAKP